MFMSFMPTVVTLAAAGSQQVRELPMPDWAFGGIAFATFLALLGMLWFFRNTASKYDTPIRVRHDDSVNPSGTHWGSDPGAHH